MELEQTHVAAGTLVRVYLPYGLYPAASFLSEDAAFHVLEDLVFSVIKVQRPNPLHFERPWSFPDEIRLLTALALSIDPGVLYPYPSSVMFSLHGNDRSLADPELGLRVADRLRRALPKAEGIIRNDPDLRALPPTQYEIHENGRDVVRMRSIFQAVALHDDLLLRGLGALLKGPLLAHHYCFHTEACMALHVAMEASGQLIRRHLEIRGMPSSYVDAGDYLAEAFGNRHRGLRYFEAFYDDRIKATHPESRLGTFADAPLAADDFYDLYDQLVAVYDFILTGTKREEFSG